MCAHMVGALIFLSTPSARRATCRYRRRHCGRCISIHALREEGDTQSLMRWAAKRDFYPRPPRGGRPESDEYKSLVEKFLSTPSARRATLPVRRWRAGRCYFYPRPPRGGRPLPFFLVCRYVYFYPRPPRGGRLYSPFFAVVAGLISIHALREEGDAIIFSRILMVSLFLSTPSARRATNVAKMETDFDEFLSTPSARRATI